MIKSTALDQSAGASGIASLLAERNFALFFLGAGISDLGTAVGKAGLTLALLVKGYSPSVVGIILAAELVPTITFSLAGGVFGDWWPRRRLMIASDLLRCSSQGALAIFLAIGHVPVVILLILSACLGLGDAFYTPAINGMVPQIAPPSHLRTANSARTLASSLAMVIGPAIGGLLVGFGGGVAALAVDAVSFAVSAACMACVNADLGTAPARESEFLGALRSGWREFCRHTWLVLLTVQIALQNAIALAMFFVIGPSIFAHLHGGPQAWGLVLGGVGAGGLIGGLIVLKFQCPRPLICVEIGCAAASSPIVLLALGAATPVLCLGSFVFGVTMATTNTIFQTAIQTEVPGEYLSRIGSIVNLMVVGLIPLGYALSGPATDTFGACATLGTSAMILLVAAAILVSSRAIRTFEMSQQHEDVRRRHSSSLTSP